MAYQVKRSARVEEELELLSADGKESLMLCVRLDASSVTQKISQQYVELLNLQARLGKMKNEGDKIKLFEEIGSAVVVLFRSVFGETDTDRIIQFYEEDYVDMCRTILPFITEVVLPRVRKEAQKSRKAKLQYYNRGSHKGW